MPSSQSEWDAKHRLAAQAPAAEPAGIVRELLPLLPTGHALDLACGTGRHTLLLARAPSTCYGGGLVGHGFGNPGSESTRHAGLRAPHP
jgi:hypothetical protein